MFSIILGNIRGHNYNYKLCTCQPLMLKMRNAYHGVYKFNSIAP